MKTLHNALTILSSYENENFNEIIDHPGYWISNYGRVLSWKYNEPLYLKPATDREGYSHVRLFKPSETRPVLHKVHRLVAKSFLPLDSTRKYVNHKDGIKSNNHVDNLEWCTMAENLAHARALGLVTFGPKKVHVTYYDGSVDTFRSIYEASRALNVTKSTIKQYSQKNYMNTSIMRDVVKITLDY